MIINEETIKGIVSEVFESLSEGWWDEVGDHFDEIESREKERFSGEGDKDGEDVNAVKGKLRTSSDGFKYRIIDRKDIKAFERELWPICKRQIANCGYIIAYSRPVKGKWMLITDDDDLESIYADFK